MRLAILNQAFAVLRELEHGPRTLRQLGAAIRKHPRTVRRYLDVLVLTFPITVDRFDEREVYYVLHLTACPLCQRKSQGGVHGAL